MEPESSNQQAMMHHRDVGPGEVQADDTRAKRQRRPGSESDIGNEQGPHDQHSEQFQGNDCYYEILQGPVKGCIHSSWLMDPQTLLASSVQTISHMESQTGPANYSQAIKSQGQQLLQVKRRLWPAAERCAEAAETTAQYEFSQARRLCNPMEPLGEGRARGLNHMFMNRAAIKLANIDALLDFGLTHAEEPQFRFVDLCGAPGGFSEYLMRRLQATRRTGSCQGYGMSLLGKNEHGNGTPWKLDHVCYQQGSFQTNYRVSEGADGTGDIYRWENVIGLANEIQNNLNPSGLHQQKVHLVVADGGFDAQRDSECQEELAQKLILCEMAAGLHLLGNGGRMVLKMFGFQTSSVRTAMQSLSDMFDDLSVLKPISSRPASSERYVVFAGFRGVANGWNSQSWLSKVLLGTAANNPPAHYVNINNYLDTIDNDMLSLNLKACFTILSNLERKTAAMQSWPHDQNESNAECPGVNVHMYKTAWRLD